MADGSVRQELLRLAKANGGHCTPEQVVEAARDPRSPLHSQFEWRDGEAAHKWRLHQARNLLRVQITIVDNKPVRAFVSLTPDRGDDAIGYRLLSNVTEDEARTQQMLDDAMAELRVFRRKYEKLRALAPLWQAIDVLEAEELGVD